MLIVQFLIYFQFLILLPPKVHEFVFPWISRILGKRSQQGILLGHPPRAMADSRRIEESNERMSVPDHFP